MEEVVGGHETPKTTESGVLQPLFGAPFVLDNVIACIVPAVETERDPIIQIGEIGIRR